MKKSGCSSLQIMRAAVVFLAAGGCLLGASAGSVSGADWKWMGKDENSCQWFLDSENVKYLAESKVLFWLKRVVSDEERNKLVAERMKHRLPMAGYDRWSYEVGMMELDCREATLRQFSISDYDKDGKFLKARKIGDNLTGITSNTIGEMVYREVCSPKDSGPRIVGPQFPSQPGSRP